MKFTPNSRFALKKDINKRGKIIKGWVCRWFNKYEVLFDNTTEIVNILEMDIIEEDLVKIKNMCLDSIKNEIKYVIVKMDNKYYPRINSKMGSVWYDKPYGYDKVEDAIQALKNKKRFNEELTLKNKEEIVYTLV